MFLPRERLSNLTRVSILVSNWPTHLKRFLSNHQKAEQTRVNLKEREASVSHNLSVWASEVEEHHADAVVGGHAQTLEGLLEKNASPDAGLLREEHEAFVYVNAQHTRLAVPAARCTQSTEHVFTRTTRVLEENTSRWLIEK